MRYGLHLIDMNLEGVWENRSKYVYYTELVFELAALSIDFGHHLHMLVSVRDSTGWTLHYLNPYMMYRLSHCYHLDESTFIFRAIRVDFIF